MWQLHFCADFTSDVVLYDVKILANFYKVQQEHIKRDVAGCAYLFQIPWGYVCANYWQNWMTFDKVITNIKKILFFS